MAVGATVVGLKCTIFGVYGGFIVLAVLVPVTKVGR